MAKVTPFDFLNPKTQYADRATALERFSICRGCEFLTAINTCEKCGCFMIAKTRLAKAECPIGKWGEVD